MNAEILNQAPSIMVLASSFLSVFFALVVLLSNNPVASAVALMGTLFSSAAIYFALGNYFMGSVQILVYAGAIAVLFVFIVMLLDLKPHMLRFIPGRKAYVLATAAAGVLLGFFILKTVFAETNFGNSGAINPDFKLSAQQISQFFISNYQMAFQAAGLLVFGAILGAIVLARGHLKSGAENTGGKAS